MPNTKSGPSLARVARSSVRRNEVGSAQCRSSKANTVGPKEARRDTTARRALKVSRCSS